ncbi:MAG: HepT-like ribonuclease domain-containing protein [Bryobacteraceae bacterium]
MSGSETPHPEVPWRLIAGTRDKLIHYEGVDLDEVWKMVTADLPRLIGWIEPLVPPKS